MFNPFFVSLLPDMGLRHVVISFPQEKYFRAGLETKIGRENKVSFPFF